MTKLAIVHLSDIHFKSPLDVGFKRAEQLANTIRFSRSTEEKLVFLISGDIANTGAPEEYAIAQKFFNIVFLSLGVKPDGQSNDVTFVPGNHDCNFRALGDLRPRLLAEVPSQLESLDENGETVTTLLKVLSDFFVFEASVTGELTQPSDQLFRIRKIKCNGLTLELRCFNSAWLSQRNEDQGSLGFPQAVLRAAAAKTDSDVVISLIHHPDRWLTAASSQNFRRAVQESSDFLFTGHEHTTGGQLVTPFGGTELVHFESGPYQPDNSGSSEFGILHLDLNARTWRHEGFSWSGGSYKKSSEGSLHSLVNKQERLSTLQVTESFLKKLHDPGTGFLHPRQQQLRLTDIYVYPDLRTRSVSRRLRVSGDLPALITSREVPLHLLRAKRVVVAGPTDCGKTALSKMLFIEANTRWAKNCLLLCGNSIKGSDPEKSFRVAEKAAINEQYGEANSGQYAAISPDQRALIIDDWDRVGFNRAGRESLLQHASLNYSQIILFTDDLFLIQELAGRQQEHPSLGMFEIVDVREFGFRLRGELIRKWHSLGNTFVEDEQVLARNIADSTGVIDTVLGRNLLPSYPINVITLLQTYDAGESSQNSGLGSYGQVYEALITARLTKVSIKSIDIGTKITFLSRVAWRMFSSSRRFVDRPEWRELGEDYFSEYKVHVQSEVLLESFLLAGILIEDESLFRFAYGYGYCYFVAKYFQENLADLDESTGKPALYKLLTDLSEKVYKQDNASIVIFYVFLTKDRFLIDHVIANARTIFSDVDEFDFDSHLTFVNEIIKPLTYVELPGTRPEENRLSYDQRRDDSGEQIEPRGDPALTDLLYTPEMPFEQKLIIGIRYLTLMGQILRNFPGSLKATVKLELAFESYSLGLRILGSVFGLAQQDAEGLRREIAGILRHKMAFSGTDRELDDRAGLIIAEMLREVAFALIKRTSHAIGLKELEATYEEVSALRDNNLPGRFIQLSIRLDHFQTFPKSEIELLAKELAKNTFSYQTLRDLVLNHFYLFPEKYTLQQWAGDILGFQVNVPQVVGTSTKLLSN